MITAKANTWTDWAFHQNRKPTKLLVQLMREGTRKQNMITWLQLNQNEAGWHELPSFRVSLASEISLYTLFSYMQANRRPHDWQGTPMPWDVFELGLHCWRAAWPHLAPTKGTPGGIMGVAGTPGRGSSGRSRPKGACPPAEHQAHTPDKGDEALEEEHVVATPPLLHVICPLIRCIVGLTKCTKEISQIMSWHSGTRSEDQK